MSHSFLYQDQYLLKIILLSYDHVHFQLKEKRCPREIDQAINLPKVSIRVYYQ